MKGLFPVPKSNNDEFAVIKKPALVDPDGIVNTTISMLLLAVSTNTEKAK